MREQDSLWATVVKGAPTDFHSGRKGITLGEIQHPAAIFSLWTPSERAAIGVFPVVFRGTANQMFRKVSGYTFSFDGSTVFADRQFTAIDIDDAKDILVTKINMFASQIILAVMPEYKQRNYLALGLEMTIAYGHDEATWPKDAQAAYKKASPIWNHIKNIRKTSNEMVAEVMAYSTIEQCEAFDWETGWPIP